MSCSKKLGFFIWFDSIEGNVAVVACVVGLLGKPAFKEAKSQKISVHIQKILISSPYILTFV